MGVQGFNSLFNAFGNDVVSDTAKGLQADHIQYAAFGKVDDFRWQKPPFPELGRHIDDGFAIVSQFKNIFNGGKITEFLSHLVEFLNLAVYPAIQDIGNKAGDMVPFQAKLFVGNPVDKGLHKERRE